MNIETQMIDFLESRIRDSDTKRRNINMVLHFYGFRGSPWPTLEDTAAAFGLSNRERSRQIIDRNFKKVATLSDFPALAQISESITDHQYWTFSGLQNHLQGMDLVGPTISLPGLFNLMHDFGVDQGYNIYTFDTNRSHLRIASRNSIERNGQHFVIRKSDVDNVNDILKKARTLPGQYGIAKLSYLEGQIPDGFYSIYRALVMDIIRGHEFAWVKETEDDFWYIFQDRDNTLINFCEKVFSLSHSYDLRRLAQTLRNALDFRRQKFDFPSEELILEYLQGSDYFDVADGSIQFNDEVDISFTEIEKDIIEFLSAHGDVSFTDLRSRLSARGYGRPLIVKSATTSPLVHVDKSQGYGHYRYSLIGVPSLISDRYDVFKRKLGSLMHTDMSIEDRARAEQDILRQYLLDGVERPPCAICGGEYSAAALRAAHKKMRSECTDAERRDPNIVMPLCVFGCDFLYEVKAIFIDNGIVVKGSQTELGPAAEEYMRKILGRSLQDRWLEGSDAYFVAPEL